MQVIVADLNEDERLVGIKSNVNRQANARH